MAYRDPDVESTGPLEGGGARDRASVSRRPGDRRWYAWVTPATGWLTILVSLAAIVGWMADSDALTRMLPSLTPMRPLTAAALAVAGSSLLLLRDAGAARWRLVAGALLALITLLVGVLIVFEHSPAVDSDIGRYLSPERLARLDYEHPGRPSLISSLGLILTGLGLLALRAPAGWKIGSQAAGLLLLLLALPVLIGNIYGVEAFYAFAGLMPTPLNASLALIMLGIGLLLAHPEQAPISLLTGDDLGGRVVRRLVPVAIILPLLLGWLDLQAQNAEILSAEVGIAALVLSLIVLLVTLIWFTAGTIRRLDSERLRSLVRERRAGEAEQAARREIEALLASTPTGVYGLDLDGRCTLINEAGARMLGYTPGELLGLRMHGVMHHTDHAGRPYPVEECPIYKAFGADRGVHVEDEVFWRRDGTSFPAEYSSAPIRQEGRVVGAVVTFLDVTEKKRTAREERALSGAVAAVAAANSLEEATQAIADRALEGSGSDGAFVEQIASELDETRVVAVAGAVAPPLGSAVPLADSHAKEVLERSKDLIVPRIADSGRPLPGDIAREHPDCTAAILPLAHAGMALGVLVLLRTPKRQPFEEDELARARTFVNLAALAFRRVFLLHESERAREELHRTMASRERLVRGFSHDLKNPLGAADGQLQLLEMSEPGELKEDQAHGIVRARRSIARAIGLIDDLTEFARTDSARIEIELVPVDARKIGWETAEEFRGPAEAKELALRIEAPQTLSPMESDSSRIRQVLGNLISNAIKYTDAGSIEVRVREVEGHAPTPSLRRGQWIVIDVADTGPGIPSDKHSEVFEEFVRLQPETVPGAGIGLAMSRRVARALGGEITLESEVGKGSTFSLWLPRRG